VGGRGISPPESSTYFMVVEATMSKRSLTRTFPIGMPNQLGQTKFEQVNRPPDACPICHRGIEAKLVSNGFWIRENEIFQAVFQCVNHKCRNIFIATYYRSSTTNGNWELYAVEPAQIPIAKEVAAISPDFVTIRQQVAAAESMKFDQLVGIGLRKALETLIKDFAISEHPQKVEEVKKEFLGICIEKYIPDTQVKQCAKRATWLGNDHAHYIKKWETKDVSDLKTLVTLTVNWIHNHLATKQFVGDMPEGK
jgi:hypothetical protein